MFKYLIKHIFPLTKGIEPLTSRLTVVCSNQLSYASMWVTFYRQTHSKPIPPNAGLEPATPRLEV